MLDRRLKAQIKIYLSRIRNIIGYVVMSKKRLYYTQNSKTVKPTFDCKNQAKVVLTEAPVKNNFDFFAVESGFM